MKSPKKLSWRRAVPICRFVKMETICLRVKRISEQAAAVMVSLSLSSPRVRMDGWAVLRALHYDYTTRCTKYLSVGPLLAWRHLPGGAPQVVQF